MGWQDAPEVGGSAWASAPLADQAPQPDLKRKLAEETSNWDAFKIGAGRMSDRLVEGTKQAGMGIGAIFSEALPERFKRAAQDELAKRLMAQERRMASDSAEYKPLEQAHPISTGLGEAVPLVAAPMLRAVEGAGAGAAAINSAVSAAAPAMMEYGTAGERAERGALSGGAGAIGSGLTSGAVKVLSGVKNVLTPEAQRIAALAEEKFGIPLDAAQKTGNKALQSVNAALENMPVTAGAEIAKKNAQRSTFTREVMKTLGETADEATPATLAAGKKRMGGEFERIFSKVHVNLDDDAVQAGIGKVIQESIDTLPPDQARIVAKRAGEIIGKIDDNGAVAGKAYQAWRSAVQQQAEKSNDQWLAQHLRGLYRAVDEAAYKSAADVGEDAALKTVRGQYSNMKTIAPLVGKSDDGILSSKLLRGEVLKKHPNFEGSGDLGELARIGHGLIADQVPNSGTAQRAMAQTLLTGGIGGATWASTGDPQKAMQATAGTMAGTLALPKMAQLALGSRAVQNFMVNGKQITPLQRALMDRAAKFGPLAIAHEYGDQ